MLDVGRGSANGDQLDVRTSQEVDKSGMLHDDGRCILVRVETFSPDGVKSFDSQPRQRVRPFRSHHTMGQITILSLTEKTAVIDRMPVLTVAT